MIYSLIVISLVLFFGFILSIERGISINSSGNRITYIFLVSIDLILQSGLRNVAVGADTYEYFRNFESVKFQSWDYIYFSFSNYYVNGIGKEPAYQLIQKCIQLVVDDYQVYLIILATFFFVSLGRFLYKYSTYLSDLIFAYILYAILFYQFFSITGHRQTIATAIILFSFDFIINRKLIKFTLIVLIAFLFHKSALIFFPFYFVANFKKLNLLYLGTLIIFPILMVYKNQISGLMKILAGYDEYGEYTGAGTYTFTFLILLIYLISFLRLRFLNNMDDNFKPIFASLILAILFTPLTFVNPSAMRIVLYFSIFLMVQLPALMNTFLLQNIRLRGMILTSAITLLMALFIKTSSKYEYAFFWQEMELPDNY
jgi:transmembrane protein EpsG